MFNTISPNVFQLLRQRTGLSQTDFGKRVGARRQTVSKFESGTAQPNKAQEMRILEVAKCSKEEFVELVCEQLSKLIDRPVGVRQSHHGYEPTTALAKANALVRKPVAGLPAVMARTLHNKIRTTRALGLAFESNNADLLELLEDCEDATEEKEDDHES